MFVPAPSIQLSVCAAPAVSGWPHLLPGSCLAGWKRESGGSKLPLMPVNETIQSELMFAFKAILSSTTLIIVLSND